MNNFTYNFSTSVNAYSTANILHCSTVDSVESFRDYGDKIFVVACMKFIFIKWITIIDKISNIIELVNWIVGLGC
jgi:hypothetical protein